MGSMRIAKVSMVFWGFCLEFFLPVPLYNSWRDLVVEVFFLWVVYGDRERLGVNTTLEFMGKGFEASC